MANGEILGLAQISGNAPLSTGFNVLLMADGFTAAQQGTFDQACDTFRGTLLAAAPYNQVTDRINIFKLNVASLESGVGDGGTLKTCNNYFGSMFDAVGRWLLICAEDLAHTTAAELLPEHTVAIVVANTSKYGGSGGQVPVYSLDRNSPQIALHEMGHSVFHLADEYGSPQGTYEQIDHLPPDSEPIEPNVTRNTDFATLKWRGAVQTGQSPILRNADCSRDNIWNTLPSGAVGLFEGARYHYCGLYRPQFDCRMRSLDKDFCVVCQQVILNYFANYSA
jgi:hypothetical protein